MAAGDVNENRSGRAAGGRAPSSFECRGRSRCAGVCCLGTQRDGRLNGLINNAGILRDGLLVKNKATGAVIKMSTDQWNAVLAVNLHGATLHGARSRCQDGRNRQPSGRDCEHVVARAVRQPRPVKLCVGKAALAANAVTWAREFGPLGIRCVAIAPGMIETPMTQE